MKFSATTGITLICAAGFLIVSMAHAVEPTSLPKPGGAMMKGGDKDGGKGGKDKMRTPSATKMKEGGKDGDKGGKGGKDKMRTPGANKMKEGGKDDGKGGKGGKDKMRMPGGTLHKNENENMGSKGGKGKMTAPGATGIIGEEGMRPRQREMGR